MMKKNRILAFILALITALSLIGCSGKGVSADVVDCIKLGAKYLEDGEYEEAIEAYEDALELDEYAWEAHTGLITAMSKAERPEEEIEERVTLSMTATKEKAEDGIEEEELEDLEELYETALDVVEGNNVLELEVLITTNDVLEDNPFEDEYVDKLEEMVDFYLGSNNFDAAQELIDRLKDAGEDDLADELQALLDAQKEAQEIYGDALTKAVDYINAKDWSGLAAHTQTDEVKTLYQKTDNSDYVSYAMGDTVIAFYFNYNCWYYGQMENGIRTGNGGWYYAENRTDGLYLYMYEGEWANDIPNGEGYEYCALDGDVWREYDATYVDGLRHGTYTGVYVDQYGNEWEYEYTINYGKFQAVEVDDYRHQETEGYITYAVLYFDDEYDTMIEFPVAENHVEGIWPFAR